MSESFKKHSLNLQSAGQYAGSHEWSDEGPVLPQPPAAALCEQDTFRKGLRLGLGIGRVARG